jgi:hypothetical protein
MTYRGLVPAPKLNLGVHETGAGPERPSLDEDLAMERTYAITAFMPFLSELGVTASAPISTNEWRRRSGHREDLVLSRAWEWTA